MPFLISEMARIKCRALCNIICCIGCGLNLSRKIYISDCLTNSLHLSIINQDLNVFTKRCISFRYESEAWKLEALLTVGIYGMSTALWAVLGVVSMKLLRVVSIAWFDVDDTHGPKAIKGRSLWVFDSSISLWRSHNNPLTDWSSVQMTCKITKLYFNRRNLPAEIFL